MDLEIGNMIDQHQVDGSLYSTAFTVPTVRFRVVPGGTERSFHVASIFIFKSILYNLLNIADIDHHTKLSLIISIFCIFIYFAHFHDIAKSFFFQNTYNFWYFLNCNRPFS